jgi:two-component sensor histidine kinase
VLSAAAQIIVSELVTNAIRHAGTDLEVTIVRGRRELHLHVRDRSPRIPRLYSFDSHEPEHSRGLKLIDGLAASWGTTLRPYGKSVWATLPVMPGIPVPSQ